MMRVSLQRHSYTIIRCKSHTWVGTILTTVGVKDAGFNMRSIPADLTGNPNR